MTLEPHNQCLPMGVPRTTPFPFRFVQNYTDKHAVAPLHPGRGEHPHATVRFSWTAGSIRADELDSTWLGHSIGRWEGDTLVIDTVGFNDKFWFDRRGHPHTEQLHTIERWTRKDMGHMENVVTIDDPGAYTKPFTVTFMATVDSWRRAAGVHLPGEQSIRRGDASGRTCRRLTRATAGESSERSSRHDLAARASSGSAALIGCGVLGMFLPLITRAVRRTNATAPTSEEETASTHQSVPLMLVFAFPEMDVPGGQ